MKKQWTSQHVASNKTKRLYLDNPNGSESVKNLPKTAMKDGDCGRQRKNVEPPVKNHPEKFNSTKLLSYQNGRNS